MAVDISPKQTYVTKQKRKNIFLGLYGIFLLFLALGITIYILIFLNKYSAVVWLADGLLVIIIFVTKVYLKNQDKEVDHWHKGEKGEAITQKIIKLLPPTYTCFEDVHLPDITGNIDHIVVGPNGIFSIETKNIQPMWFEGKIQLPQKQYVDICDQTYRQAMDVQRFLNIHNINIDLVIPVLSLAHSHYKTAKQTWLFKGARVVPTHLLGEYITNLKNNQLSWEEYVQIIEKLTNISSKRTIT